MAAPRGPSDDTGVSEVLSTSLLLGLTVSLLAIFAFIILNVPPPTAEPHADLQAFVLPRDPQTVVIEHRGGASVPLMAARIRLQVEATEVSAVLGERLLAADPQWTVLGVDGAPKTPDQELVTGDRVLYTSATVPGSRIELFVADEIKQSPVLDAAVIQLADAAPPAFVSARTVTTTSIEIAFTEPLDVVNLADFAFSDGIVASAAERVGNGSKVRFTTSAFPADATPTIWTTVTPYGSRDYAGIDVTGGDVVVATDGVAPTISAVSPGAPSETTTTVTWTTDEMSTSVVRYGPSSSLGRTSFGVDGTSHAVTIGPLSELTLYYFLVESTDPAGNTAQSTVATFVTDDDLLGVENLTINVFGGDSLDVVTVPVVAGVITPGFSVGLFDPDGNPLPADSDVVVHLQSNRTTGRFYDALGVAEVTTVTIPVGSQVAQFRYRDTLAGSASIVAAAERIVGDADGFLVAPGPHRAWRVGPAQAADAGDVVNVNITATDAFGNRVTTYTTATSFTFAGAGSSPVATPKAGAALPTTYFGAVTGPFAFSAGVAPAKLQLFKAEVAHVVVTDTALGYTNAAAPADIFVSAGPLAQLGLAPQGQSIASGLWAGPFEVRMSDTWGNDVVEAVPRSVTITSAGGTLSPTPGGLPTSAYVIPAGTSSVEFYVKYPGAGVKTVVASTTAPVLSTSSTIYVEAAPTGLYLQFTTIPNSAFNGLVSNPFVVTLMAPDGTPTTPTAPLTIVFTTNSTHLGHFRTVDGADPITRIVMPTTSSTVTFTYVDGRNDNASSALGVFATNVVPDMIDYHIIGRGGGGGGGRLENRLHVNLIHPALQLKNSGPRQMGAAIMNPLPSPQVIDKITFEVNPGIAQYFRDVAVLAGSDAGWIGCALSYPGGGATAGNTVVCNPSVDVPLPAMSKSQLVLSYRSPNADGQTVLKATVTFTSGPAPITAEMNVRVTSSGSLEVMPLAGPGGNTRAAIPDMAKSSVQSFYIRFKLDQGSGNIHTRLFFPPGWSDIKVPAQPVLADVTVGIRQPGFDQDGFILFSQPYNTNTVREILIQARTPNIEGLDALSLEGSDTIGNWQAIERFGVHVS